MTARWRSSAAARTPFYRQDAERRRVARARAARRRAGWGCRGRWVAVARGRPTGASSPRDARTQGIAPRALDPPSGGRPALAPARVRLNDRPHRDVARTTARPDPAARDGRRTLFGDIHQHSAHSDGMRHARTSPICARATPYGDDFCALTDHESFIGKRIGPGEWAISTAVADRHDDAGGASRP